MKGGTPTGFIERIGSALELLVEVDDVLARLAAEIRQLDR